MKTKTLLHAAYAKTLKAVKPFIYRSIDVRSGGCSLYICNAIRRADHLSLITHSDAKATMSLIESRIEGHSSLTHWIIARGVKPEDYPNFEDLMQRYRHAWVDQMIAEFSAKSKVC